MTPRVAPLAAKSPDYLDVVARRVAWAERWCHEIDELLLLVQSLVTEEPSRRLTGVRAHLDRAEYLRSELAQIVRNMKSDMHTIEFDHDAAAAALVEHAHGGFTARGMASDERRSMYLLRNRAAERQMAEVRAGLTKIVELDRHVAAVLKSMDGHRMESITLLRSNITLSREELLAFRALQPNPPLPE